jgi:hypothetical protein
VRDPLTENVKYPLRFGLTDVVGLILHQFGRLIGCHRGRSFTIDFTVESTAMASITCLCLEIITRRGGKKAWLVSQRIPVVMFRPLFSFNCRRLDEAKRMRYSARNVFKVWALLFGHRRLINWFQPLRPIIQLKFGE